MKLKVKKTHKVENNAVVVDLSGWTADITYNEGLVLCEQLKLIEQLRHGDVDYGRLTQTGINVLATLMQLGVHASYPENRLKGS